MRCLKLFKFLKRFFNNDSLEWLLKDSKRSGRKRFVIIWNRGLGDIALGLYAFAKKVKENIRGAELVFLTRMDLVEAFSLLDGVDAVSVPWWERGEKLSKTDAEKAIQRLGLDIEYDIVVEKVDPTKQLSDQVGKLTPRLKWRNSFDALCERFDDLMPAHNYGGKVIGVHIESETDGFYGYKKDWDMERWSLLFDRLIEDGFFIILFGLEEKYYFKHESILDLGGRTSILECLSIIKNRCNILIAPDSGILSLTYYLDVFFPILVVSIWSDPHQGVLKQAVDSPNKGLRHRFLIGENKDVSKITPEDVYKTIKENL